MSVTIQGRVELYNPETGIAEKEIKKAGKETEIVQQEKDGNQITRLDSLTEIDRLISILEAANPAAKGQDTKDPKVKELQNKTVYSYEIKGEGGTTATARISLEKAYALKKLAEAVNSNGKPKIVPLSVWDNLVFRNTLPQAKTPDPSPADPTPPAPSANHKVTATPFGSAEVFLGTADTRADFRAAPKTRNLVVLEARLGGGVRLGGVIPNSTLDFEGQLVAGSPVEASSLGSGVKNIGAGVKAGIHSAWLSPAQGVNLLPGFGLGVNVNRIFGNGAFISAGRLAKVDGLGINPYAQVDALSVSSRSLVQFKLGGEISYEHAPNAVSANNPQGQLVERSLKTVAGGVFAKLSFGPQSNPTICPDEKTPAEIQKEIGKIQTSVRSQLESFQSNIDKLGGLEEARPVLLVNFAKAKISEIDREIKELGNATYRSPNVKARIDELNTQKAKWEIFINTPPKSTAGLKRDVQSLEAEKDQNNQDLEKIKFFAGLSDVQITKVKKDLIESVAILEKVNRGDLEKQVSDTSLPSEVREAAGKKLQEVTKQLKENRAALKLIETPEKQKLITTLEAKSKELDGKIGKLNGQIKLNQKPLNELNQLYDKLGADIALVQKSIQELGEQKNQIAKTDTAKLTEINDKLSRAERHLDNLKQEQKQIASLIAGTELTNSFKKMEIERLADPKQISALLQGEGKDCTNLVTQLRRLTTLLENLGLLNQLALKPEQQNIINQQLGFVSIYTRSFPSIGFISGRPDFPGTNKKDMDPIRQLVKEYLATDPAQRKPFSFDDPKIKKAFKIGTRDSILNTDTELKKLFDWVQEVKGIKKTKNNDKFTQRQLEALSKATKLIISGHTDSNGKREDNIILSQNRAELEAAALILFGYEGPIEWKGYGPDQPETPERDEKGKLILSGERLKRAQDQNRRVVAEPVLPENFGQIIMDNR